MQKVLVSASHFDTLCKDAWKLMEANGIQVIFDPGRSFPAYSTEEIERHPDREEIAAALIGMDDFRDEKKFKALPNLKAVAKFGVGVDNIDGALASQYGVKVLNAPGQNSNAVAELTIAYILDLLRHVIILHKEMEQGKWPRFIGNEIKGKTVGLLGFGAIAKLVARKLQSFDVEVLAYDLYPDQEAARRLGVKIVSQEEILTKSDIVSIHIPATADTYHMFNDSTFASMKHGAYLVNPARGALVDLDALARAMQKGLIAGAALDAFEVEPLPKEAEILQCENIVLTPHTGAETEESYDHVSMTTAKDIISVLKGESPVNWVNK
ncbi:MAG TPA: phosphoglycerate dehydrogenase [Lachnospiraceae bacterium]|nr:phosphoglycerate dehydrogenase [Lachnospiraceae bacterium]